eukprot:2629424-Amphidinium_carterae.1
MRSQRDACFVGALTTYIFCLQEVFSTELTDEEDDHITYFTTDFKLFVGGFKLPRMAGILVTAEWQPRIKVAHSWSYGIYRDFALDENETTTPFARLICVHLPDGWKIVELLAEAMQELTSLVACPDVLLCVDFNVELGSHTDGYFVGDIATASYTEAGIGIERANLVYDFLAQHKVCLPSLAHQGAGQAAAVRKLPATWEPIDLANFQGQCNTSMGASLSECVGDIHAAAVQQRCGHVYRCSKREDVLQVTALQAQTSQKMGGEGNGGCFGKQWQRVFEEFLGSLYTIPLADMIAYDIQ